MTRAGIRALAELKSNKEEDPTVRWQGGPLLMTLGSGCFQSIVLVQVLHRISESRQSKFFEEVLTQIPHPLDNFEG